MEKTYLKQTQAQVRMRTRKNGRIKTNNISNKTVKTVLKLTRVGKNVVVKDNNLTKNVTVWIEVTKTDPQSTLLYVKP